MSLKYEAIVIGTSAGGIKALETIFSRLNPRFEAPIFVVQHISAHSDNYLVEHFKKITALKVVEACDKENIRKRSIYFPPPDYHLLIEPGYTLALSRDEKVNFSRPSIDVLFESAADVYGEKLIGILLTGANHDGANGLYYIHQKGGFTIVQEPAEAEVNTMPLKTLELFQPHRILKLKQIASILWELTRAG